MVDSFCNGMSGMSNQQGFVEEEEEDNGSEEEYVSFNTSQGGGERPFLPNPSVGSPSFVASTPAYKSRTPSKSPGSKQLHFSMEVSQRARPSPERLEARIWSLEKKQETVIDLVQDMKNQNSDLKQAVKDLKDEYGDLIRQVKELVINQRPQPPQQMYPSPYAGSMYRPPPPHPSHYNYQPTPPMMPQPAYSYSMPMSPGPGSRPIPSRINNRVSQFTPQNDVDEEYYEGEFYEDDGHGLYGPDCSGWTVNHKPGLEGANAMNYSTQGQQMPPAGFFAQALRGQALQFQQGQLLTGQAGKQGSPMMTTGMLSMSTTQSVSPGMFPGTQPQTVPGAVPGVFTGTGSQIVQPQPAATVPGMFPVQTQTGSMIPDKVQQGELAGLLATDSTPPKVDSTEKKTPLLSKPSDVQQPIFGTSPSTQVFGNVSSSGNTPNTMPLLSSLMAASTSPDKPLTNPPVTMVTSVAPKGTFTFGQTSSMTGNQSPFNFGQVSSTTPGTGVNIFTSPQKNSSMTPGIGANIFSSPQKENIFAGKAISREASPVKSPSKTGDDHIDEYEPNVDFKPVIDLPDLVETKTGEEEEESMFCERAKLFRFDDGQWKERGTGQMKLLRHKETKRVRVLMRRDQVLKICANHFLTKDMKLSPMQSSNKAWCWNAQDFSDGEIQVEKLAVRFKDPDIASRFQSTFEKLQSELDNVVQPKKEPSKPVSTGQPSLGSLFKKEEGSWKCDACLINNKADVQKCVSCEALKPGVKVKDVKQTETKGHSFNFSASTGGFNIANTTVDQKPSTGSGFIFQSGTKPASPGGFKFGQTTVTEKNKSEAAKPDSTSAASSGFKFGQLTKTIETDTSKPPLSAGFKFGQVPQTEKTKTESSGFTFGSTSTTDKKSEQVKQDQAATDSAKSSPFSKPSGFIFGGGPTATEVSKDKPALPFTFKPNVMPKETPTKNDAKDDKPASTFVFKPSTPIATATSQKVTEIAKPEPTKKDDKKGFGDLFKVKEGSWKCDGCLMSNSGDILKCPACETLKPGVKKEDVKDTGKSVFGSGASTISFGEKGGFSFGASSQSDSKSASGFSFTPTTTKDKPDSKPAAGFTPTMSDSERNKPDSGAKGFNFTLEPTKTDTPSKSSSGFNFTLSPTKGGAAGPQSPPTDADGMYVNKDGEDDHIHFEPVIELPSVVDIATGEEEDEVLFQHRAKLFRFVNGEWKERGLGDIKISKNKESGKVRLLMRREQILKICLNHYLSKELELKPKPNADGKAWIWFAIDFSDNEPEMQQLAIRFKNQEIAANFKKTFDDAKDKLVHADSSERSPSQNTEEKSVPRSAIRTDEIEIIGVDEATDDQIKMARKFMLPDHFYLYESVPPCPGCIGCEDYKPGKICSPPKPKGKEKVDSTANAMPSIIGQSSQPGLFGQKSEGGLSTDSRKPGGLFGSSETSVSTTDVKGGVFGGGASGGLSFTSVAKQTESSGEGIFGGGGFSFSQLAMQAESSTSPGFKVKDDNKQFTWTGTGQKLFSGGGGGDNGECDESVEDGDESGATYDPHYEPIIDLPDLVDVKTGEEDYDKLFCQRSRLFRFDKEANQWKEKGIGEMKILQHKENRRYRLILRREQVFKIACNQWLTQDISFKPLPTSETSWCWVGQDFSDNEPVIEQLAIKFKTIELAHEFKDTIDKCQKELRERNAATTEKGDASKIPATVATEQEVSRNYEEEKEYDDDDDDYTTEEEEILFDKRITFFSKEDDWKAVGLGTLKVIYDDDVNGNRITVELDNKTVVCNHLVAKESSVVVNKKDCQWSPMDFSTDEPVRRHFRAQFSSEQAAIEFQKIVQEGCQLAIESYISEKNMVTYPTEITFSEVHGGSSQ